MKPRYLAAAAAAVVVLAAGGAWLALRPQTETSVSQVCLPLPQISASENPVTAASDGAIEGLRVTESGFTQPDNRSFTPGPTISVGAVIENTGDNAAYRTRVILRASTDKGANAIDPVQAKRYLFEVPVLKPGQKVSVGTSATVYAPDSEHPAVTQARFELVQTQWVAAQTMELVPDITLARDTAQSPQADSSGGIFPFVRTSNGCHDLLNRGISMVYRDAGGAIVGGDYEGTHEDLCRQGTQTLAGLSVNPIPPAADPSQTSASAYCDIAPWGSAEPSPSAS